VTKYFNSISAHAFLIILCLYGSSSTLCAQKLRAKDYLPKNDVNRVMQSPKGDWGMESKATLYPDGITLDRTQMFAKQALVSSYEEVFRFSSEGYDSYTKASDGAQMLEESLREPIRVGTEWTATDQGEIGKLRIISVGDVKTRAGMLRNVVVVRLSGFHLHKMLRHTAYKYYAPGLGVIRIEVDNPGKKAKDVVMELTAYK
jgi:hypothetical protein